MNTSARHWRETTPGAALGAWALLAIALAVYLTLGWIAALALMAVAVIQIARPFQFLPAYLLVVAGASFVDYTHGQLTRDLTLLTIGIVFMLYCYVLEQRSRAFAIPETRMTLPLLLYMSLTGLNFVRGIVVGNSLRYAGLELIAALAIACSFLVSSQTMSNRVIQMALVGMTLTALGNSALGFRVFAEIHQRTGSVYFTAVPGLVALVLFNFALRARNARGTWLWLLLATPLLLHQFLSFTRGFWLGQIGGLLYSALAFGAWGAGARRRWRTVVVVSAELVLLVVVGAMVMSLKLGVSGLFELAGKRLVSSTGTQLTFETASNVVRLAEYGRVIRDIMLSPWIGHGLGYFFVVREPLHLQLIEQWYCHEAYLMVWLKQGIVGLALFVWMLWSALRTCHEGARRGEGWAGAWCAGAAAATVFVAIYASVYFVLVADVNTAILMALLWGGCMSVTRSRAWILRWRTSPPSPTA